MRSEEWTIESRISVRVVKTVRIMESTHHIVVIVHKRIVEKSIPVEPVDSSGVRIIVKIVITSRIIIVVVIVLIIIVGVFTIVHPRALVIPAVVV